MFNLLEMFAFVVVLVCFVVDTYICFYFILK